MQVVPGMVVFGGFGGRSNEGRVNVDGMSVGSAFNGAGVSSYLPDVANAREITMITSGGLGEAEGGGPSLNVLPKEGGNSLSGTVFASGVTGGMVGSNYTPELQARGLSTPGVTRKVWDFNLGLGGPIAKDRVWYYANLRDEGSERTVPGMFANKNAGDPTKWLYEADTTRPAVLAASYRIAALRLTSQLTARNQFTVFWDQQFPCEGGAAQGFSGGACRTSGDGEVFAGSTAAPTPSASAIASPETAAYRDYGNRVTQAKWTNPLTGRLLLERSYDLCICVVNPSPIIIDLDGDGFALTDPFDGVVFDLMANAIPVQTGWTRADSDDAFLALDRNQNGTIDDGSELFGDATAQPDVVRGKRGRRAPKNGFLALSVFDQPKEGGNGDGLIDEDDAVYSSLTLWKDANHNGVSEPEEMMSLSNAGVRAISIRYIKGRTADEFGNEFRYWGHIVADGDLDRRHNGRRRAVDVFFKAVPVGTTPPPAGATQPPSAPSPVLQVASTRHSASRQ